MDKYTSTLFQKFYIQNNKDCPIFDTFSTSLPYPIYPLFWYDFILTTTINLKTNYLHIYYY